MDEAAAPRRNHWVNHIARHAHAKPGAAYLRFEGRTVTWAQIHERVAVIAAALRERGVRAGLPRNASGKVMKTALRGQFG
jgi:fatty-acyl-CoA synthase